MSIPSRRIQPREIVVDSALNAIKRVMANDFIGVWVRRTRTYEFSKRNKKGLNRLNRALSKWYAAMKEVENADHALDRAWTPYEKGKKGR
jgi:hypothetical protein